MTPTVFPPYEPYQGASPNAKTPPSDATSQYPPPFGTPAIPTIARFSRCPAVEPMKGAPPKLKTPPSEPTSQ